ncbi:MAG TPA: hypothetical protein VG937_30735 [Polyangiaceae bacterium]|nr:hypothetical protein [Polyangiaceae bacterium]
MKRAWALVWCASIALGACQQRADSAAPGTRASSVAAAVASPSAQPAPSADPSRLPEDPVAGQRASAQWREHMEEEEVERKLNYDRRKLPDHRVVLGLLRAARGRYDQAQSKAAVLALQTSLPQALTPVKARIEKIDHWGVNSNVLSDYAELQRVLQTSYPDARIAALSGEKPAFEAARADFDARLKKVEAWLERAAESEDE